jgi:hypothetical protein
LIEQPLQADSVFPMLQRAPGLVGVVDAQRRLVGYISAENLTELVMIQSSRAATATPSSAVPAAGHTR